MRDPALPQLPKRLGIAADLNFIVRSPVGFLADCLLIYDQVVVPGEPGVLWWLYGMFGEDQVERMLKARRLVFCPAMSRWLSYNEQKEFSRSLYLSRLEQESEVFFRGNERLVLEHLDHHLLVGARPDYVRWRDVLDQAVASFEELAGRPGYEFLYPLDPRSGTPSRDRIVGLETGIARINDLAAAGVTDLELDGELAWLLNVTFPGVSGLAKLHPRAEDAEAGEVLRGLHRLKYLPPLGHVIANERWEPARALDVALSDEASELRAWLRANLAPGLDVREAYVKSLEGLPSKKYWSGWVRFAAVNTVTTAVGLITGEWTAAGLGLAISAADQAKGTAVVERAADPYHPKDWLAFAARGYER